MIRTALRIDDIGASTKRYEVYSKRLFGNFLYLKYLKSFRAWGPYREMTAEEWREVFGILEQFNAKLTVGVTASWVNKKGKLIPFPDKFPEQAEVLKKGLESGLLEIANHGLTHCVVGKHLPRIFTSNRKYHREFWHWIPREVHFEHLQLSQQILQEYFEIPITTLIPPGNVFSNDTVEAGSEYGINRINYSKRENELLQEIIKIIDGNSVYNKFLPIENVLRFHDREIVMSGSDWLRKRLEVLNANTEFVFLKNY